MPTSITTPTSLLGVTGAAPAVSSTSPLTPPAQPTVAPTQNPASLSGTMTNPTTTPPAPIYSPSTATQPSDQTQQAAISGQQSQQQAPGSNPMALSQAMTAIQNNVANNNSLITQKNLILKQLYDQPLSDADKATLDPALATTLASGDRNAIDFQLKLLNDQIAGRTNTLTQNVGYLTQGYNTAVQQAETAKQNAIQNVQNFVQQYGANAGAALGALYGPQYAQQLANMGINLQGFEQSAIPTVNQTRYLGGTLTGGAGGYNLSSYNPSNPSYPSTLASTAQSYGVVNDAATAQSIINQYSLGQSPVTGQMVMSAAQLYGVDPGLIMSIMQNESHFNTDPKGTTDISTNNPGSIMGGPGGTQTQYATIQDGVNGIAQWLANHATNQAISATAPSGPNANIVDPSTGVTPNAIYAAAVQYAATGQMPSIGQGNSAAQVRNERQQIQNIGGAILASNGGSIAGNKAQLASNSSALTQQTQYLNTIQRSITTVDQNIKLLQEAAQHVNDSSVPIVNQLTNDVKLSTGDGALNAFNAALQTVRSEYSNILARGGTVTDTTRNEASNLLPSNLTASQLNQVISVLQSEGQNVLSGAQQQVQGIQSQINSIVSPQGAGASGAGSSSNNNDPLGILGGS